MGFSRLSRNDDSKCGRTTRRAGWFTRSYGAVLFLALTGCGAEGTDGPLAKAHEAGTIDEGIPAGTANGCRNATDGFMDFEMGIDQVQIESTIPGLEFTTTSGLNWQYADVRTGQYNVRPHGTQLYETNGNFFAWLGTTGDIGRVTFIG